MRKYGLAILFVMFAIPSASADTQVVVQIIDGMTITTSDSVANIEVQAMSLGPGACAVEFSAAGKTVGLLAPPAIYTPWTVLTSNIGKVSLIINENVKCDTGVLAQVRYYQ